MAQNVMVNKLVNDFFEADAINKLLLKKQVMLEDGIPILKEMLQDVVDDFEILDQEAFTVLNNKIKDLNQKNNIRKAEIKKQTAEPEDSIDERNLKLKLLKEDHGKYRRIITIIQKLAYKKGWFE